jgi:hypothetical protein
MSFIDKKSVKFFQKIDTVHGKCEECEEDVILVAIVSDFYRCTNCGHNGSIRYLKLDELDKKWLKANVDNG